MNERLIKAFQKYEKVLDSQHFIESDLDYSRLEFHRPFLERLDVIESSVITLFDLYRREHR